jgi:hypothetical protein
MDRGDYVDRTEAERITLGELLERHKREVTPHKKSRDSEKLRIDRLIREEALCRYKATALTGKLLAEWRGKRLQEVTGRIVPHEVPLASRLCGLRLVDLE